MWTFLGFPTYGGGPFDRWGLPTSVALLLASVLVCTAEVATGVPLWRDATSGLWLTLALLPGRARVLDRLRAAFGPLLGLVRTVLVVVVLLTWDLKPSR